MGWLLPTAENELKRYRRYTWRLISSYQRKHCGPQPRGFRRIDWRKLMVVVTKNTSTPMYEAGRCRFHTTEYISFLKSVCLQAAPFDVFMFISLIPTGARKVKRVRGWWEGMGGRDLCDWVGVYDFQCAGMLSSCGKTSDPDSHLCFARVVWYKLRKSVNWGWRRTIKAHRAVGGAQSDYRRTRKEKTEKGEANTKELWGGQTFLSQQAQKRKRGGGRERMGETDWETWQ